MSTLFMAISSIYAFARAIIELVRFNAKLSSYMLVLIPVAILVFTLSGQLQHKFMKRRYARFADHDRIFL